MTISKQFVDNLKAHQKWVRSKKHDYNFPLEIQENLIDENFFKFDFKKVVFSDMNLSGAHFTKCDFTKVKFNRCNLSGVIFEGCNLTGTEFDEDCLVAGMTTRQSKLEKTVFPGSAQICPEVGSFHAFKKVKDERNQRFIIELLVSKHSKRMNSYGSRKCRCERAKVLRVVPQTNRVKPVGTLHSCHIYSFTYQVGEWVEAKLDENKNVECAGGIHFFLSQREADEYDI